MAFKIINKPIHIHLKGDHDPFTDFNQEFDSFFCQEDYDTCEFLEEFLYFECLNLENFLFEQFHYDYCHPQSFLIMDFTCTLSGIFDCDCCGYLHEHKIVKEHVQCSAYLEFSEVRK